MDNFQWPACFDLGEKRNTVASVAAGLLVRSEVCVECVCVYKHEWF